MDRFDYLLLLVAIGFMLGHVFSVRRTQALPVFTKKIVKRAICKSNTCEHSYCYSPIEFHQPFANTNKGVLFVTAPKIVTTTKVSRTTTVTTVTEGNKTVVTTEVTTIGNGDPADLDRAMLRIESSQRLFRDIFSKFFS